MKILVTGGAGYIGSFMVKRLLKDKHEVTVLDSLEKGYRDKVDSQAKLVEGNILDESFLSDLFQKETFDGIIHFAGYISMGESMEVPGKYFQNNSFGSLRLLEHAAKNKIRFFIFSSTAGVYGNPVKVPIDEDHPKNPTNPYGMSKLMVEQMLAWYQKTFGLSFASLRYFNAAGAAPDVSLGENHNPETHIIPNAIRAVLSGSNFNLFGQDYKTADGTCIRDYIHVIDLVEAHALAMEKLQKESGGYYYNVGTGKGYSNKEVLSM